MGENGRKRVVELFSLEAMGDALQAHMEELVPRSR